MSQSPQRLRAALRQLLAAFVAVIEAANYESRGRAHAVPTLLATLCHCFMRAVRRRLALLAGFSAAEVAKHFRDEEDVADAGAGSNVIAMRPVEQRTQRHAAERRGSTMFDVTSVIPPNVERAVASQLRSSHRSRMTHDELQRFLSAFGVPRGDTRGALTLLRAKGRREEITVDDLHTIQAWIGRGWIDNHRHAHGAALPEVVRTQLGLVDDAELCCDLIAQVLVGRGYGAKTAQDIAARLAEDAPPVESAGSVSVPSS